MSWSKGGTAAGHVVSGDADCVDDDYGKADVEEFWRLAEERFQAPEHQQKERCPEKESTGGA